MTPRRVAFLVIALVVLLTATIASAARVTVSSRSLTTFAGAGPTTTIVSVTSPARCNILEDAYVDENGSDKSTAHNGADLQVNSENGNKGRHTFVRMTDPSSCLPGVAASKIQSATLKLSLTGTSASGRTYNLGRVNEAWSEGALSFVDTDKWSFSPLVATATVPSSGTMTWNVTSEVKAIVGGTVTNRGWRATDANQNANPGRGSTFTSKDCTASCTDAQKPYVEVVFTP